MFLLQVRKLYKYVDNKWQSRKTKGHVNKERRMLEDPSYESVVRWGNEGDSFVVLEVYNPHRDC